MRLCMSLVPILHHHLQDFKPDNAYNPCNEANDDIDKMQLRKHK